MYNEEKFGWETCRDARILTEYQQIKNDRERMRKAQECLVDSAKQLNSILKDSPNNTPTRHSNPAIIGKLPVPKY